MAFDTLNMNVNYLWVLIATVASYVFMMILYHPKVLGNTWAKLANVKMEKKGMMNKMIIGFVTTFVTAYVLALFILNTGSQTMMGGVAVGFLVWLGFSATKGLSMNLWHGKPMKLFAMNTVAALISLMLMGAIIGAY